MGRRSHLVLGRTRTKFRTLRGKETCEDYLVEKLKLPINVLGAHWPMSSSRSSRTTIKNITLRVSLIEVTRVKVGVNLWLSQQLCCSHWVEVGRDCYFRFFLAFSMAMVDPTVQSMWSWPYRKILRGNLARSALWNRWIFFFSNLRKTLEISGKPCFIKWDPVKSSEFLVHAESTHLAKNILARLRDRARNVSDEAMNYPLKITPVESTCEYSLSSYKI